MDKLKPILAHKFWIIAFVALLVPFIGWWMDTSSLSAQIAARKGKIEEAFKAAQVGPDAPNDSWRAQVANVNAKQTDRLRQETVGLWEMQKDLMVWPSDLSEMAKVPYRGELTPASAMAFALDIFRSQYPLEVERTRELVKPFDALNPEGLVKFPKEAMAGLVPEDHWQFTFPTKDEMWDAMEDQWHMRELLTAIVAVNGDAANINEAPIREIQLLEVRGGSFKAAAASGGGGGATADPAMAGAKDGAGLGGSNSTFFPQMSGGGGVGGAGGGQGSIATQYDLTDDIGAGVEAAAGATGDPGAAAAPAPDAARGMGGGTAKKLRYVDPEESMPYRHRAFQFHLVMDHRKVPELVMQLSNLKYPVSIFRVQQVARMDDGDGSRAGGMMAGPAVGARPAFGAGGVIARPAARPRDAGFDNPRNLRPEDQQKEANAKKLEEAAMTDPFLADVAIAGIMTIYQPPKETTAPASTDPGAPSATPAAPGAEAPAAGTPTEPAPGEPKPGEPKPGEPAVPAEPKPEATTEKPEAKPADPAKPEPAKPEAAKPEAAPPAEKPAADKPATDKPPADKPATEPAPKP